MCGVPWSMAQCKAAPSSPGCRAMPMPPSVWQVAPRLESRRRKHIRLRRRWSGDLGQCLNTPPCRSRDVDTNSQRRRHCQGRQAIPRHRRTCGSPRPGLAGAMRIDRAWQLSTAGRCSGPPAVSSQNADTRLPFFQPSTRLEHRSDRGGLISFQPVVDEHKRPSFRSRRFSSAINAWHLPFHRRAETSSYTARL